ncbi:hypothetical protein C8N40_103319 [Pontibacter mucosus]|uniref:Uncharacterized protein n=1 Tax=Pontibacter mucosus TaxID=1649266 RepID=A0A2T5YLS4_9BACT|nr:hypothetical protein [Pontibacter mucosus]PTX20244.1 hypothetical protein C8N40_103319 [Pontibacter mucosus]
MQLSLNYKFLILLQSVMAFLALGLNTVLTLLLWLPKSILPLWGQHSIATYFFIFTMSIGFVVGWVATKVTRKALRIGRVLPLHWHLKSQTLIDKLPSKTFNRAFMFSLSGFSMAAILVMLLDTLQLQAIPYLDFMLLSGIYSVCVSVAITSMAVYRALSDNILRHSRI